MNFRESAKKGRGIIFNPKIYVADFGLFTRALSRAFSGKKWFSEDEGGSTAVWNFSENSSVLVASPVPNRSWCLFCCASVRVTSSHNSFSHRTVKLTWAQIVGRLRAGIETEQDNRGQLSYQIWGPITRIVPSQTKRINNQARNYSLQQYVQRHLLASCF